MVVLSEGVLGPLYLAIGGVYGSLISRVVPYYTTPDESISKVG